MKVTAMISDNLTQDFEPGDNLNEYEESDNISIRFNYRDGLDPLSKVVYDHDNVLMPPSRSWVVLTGENERSPTGRVDLVRGCLNNPSRLG
jgi:hypothetical protein